MKVDRLHIRSGFRNLENVEVDFDENHLMTVVVGRNGSGKSNVLEALARIFRNLDLGEAAPFSYFIRYEIGEKNWVKWFDVEIDANPSRGSVNAQYKIKIINKHSGIECLGVAIDSLSRDRKNNRAEFLPNFVFAYYSGSSSRLVDVFHTHAVNYYKSILKDELDLRSDIRPLFCARPIHGLFVLMAFFMDSSLEKERAFLRKELGIESLDSIQLVFKRPEWAEKNDIYWGAKGGVRDLMAMLYSHALAPIRIKRVERIGLTGKPISNEFIHLFLPSVEKLQKLSKEITPGAFFNLLDGTSLAEMIAEISIRVKVSHCAEPITFHNLSEGEQQLLTVLGLLKFTGGKDSLFLLDEPDTHLNPSWAAKYLSFLRDFVPNHDTSHLLMVTHHPLAIAELKKQQVQVMKRGDDSQVYATMPNENPRGMGINLILRSDMFGLQTTLDDDTNQKLIARNALATKEVLSKEKVIREVGGVPEDEEEYLARINTELSNMGFVLQSDDPDYLEFLQKKYHPILEVND